MTNRPLKLLVFFIFCLLTTTVLAPLRAQDSGGAVTCSSSLEKAWADASSACIGKPGGYICNGGAPPAAEPSGLVANALASVGALVDLGTVKALRTPPIQADGVGIAWLRLPDPTNVTILVLGDVTMFDVTLQGFPPWTSSIVQANPVLPACADAPRNSVIFQSSGQARIAVNGSSLVLSGTVLVSSDVSNTIFIGIEGSTTVLAQGQQQNLQPGAQVNVAHPPGNPSSASAPPAVPVPLDASYLSNLPVPLFDRPLVLPQSGYASTQGGVNMRVSPDRYSTVITQVPAAQSLTILGQNEDGTWYNVRLSDGRTGWMLAELLASNVGSGIATFSATPMPPQRLGELGTRARVHAPAGVNLRRGPDVTFPAIGNVPDGTLVDLIARSPYMNGWVKINAGGTVGWLSLLVLETQAYMDALPVDYQAPAMPTATPIPGSFGNAYPDPNGGG